MTSKRDKPVVYIASPYTQGDPAINTHFQCKVFDKLLGDKKVIPIAPLWSHFQHTLLPRSYDDWIQYNLSLLHLYDVCLRLDSVFPDINYHESQSSGADKEVAIFVAMERPVFYSINDLYLWVDGESFHE